MTPGMLEMPSCVNAPESGQRLVRVAAQGRVRRRTHNDDHLDAPAVALCVVRAENGLGPSDDLLVRHGKFKVDEHELYVDAACLGPVAGVAQDLKYGAVRGAKGNDDIALCPNHVADDRGNTVRGVGNDDDLVRLGLGQVGE